MTPAYAAPEQFDSAVGTASDVHGPGGVLPRELAATARGLPRPIPARIVSTKKTSPNTLSRVLSGALGAIARKSMLKEPELRHSSALALADDLVLFLNGHPVSARPLNFAQ